MHVFETTDAYLVEFVNPAGGSTRALAELTPDQLVPAGA
jgi:alpha-galactosidase/6-phospho-beta-glucosidase family protein